MAFGELPYGLRDIRITPLGVDGATPGTAVDLPVAQTFSFTEAEDFTDLRGDDALVASHGAGPSVEWSLEAGGITLAAYAAINGGTVTTSGTTPAAKKTYTKTISQVKPYFKVEGQAISDSGGDFHGLVYRAKVTGNLQGTLADGAFWVTSASGKGYGSLEATSTAKLYDFIQNETAVAIP